MEYYIYETAENDRWDLIATRFYGNCFDYDEIIRENFHVGITPILDAGIELRIPVKENVLNKKNVPKWK